MLVYGTGQDTDEGLCVFRGIRWVSILVSGLLCLALVPAGYSAEGPQARFERAMAARDSGDFRTASKDLRSLVADHPELGRARLELALTLFRVLSFDEARTLAESVLADPGTPPGVQATVRAFLERIEKESQPHQFNASVSAGIFYDDNVNVGPSSDILTFEGLALLLSPGATARADSALNVSLGGGHRYLFPQVFSIDNQPARLLWQTDASLFSNKYQSESAFDLDVLGLRTGPALVVPGLATVQAFGQLEDIWLGSDRLARFATVGAAVSRPLLGGTVGLSTEFQDRDYRGVNDTRDSIQRRFAVRASHPLTSRLTAFGSAGLFNENAATARFSNDGFELSAGLDWRTWVGGRINARVSWKREEHDGPEPLFGIARDDRYRRLDVTASHEFQAGSLKGFVASIYVVRSDNDSNLDLFDYQRSQLGIRFGKKF